MRERFSTATYCDFCGNGKSEVPHLVSSPTAHICEGCATLAVSIFTARRASGVDRPQENGVSLINAPIDYRLEAHLLKQAIENSATPVIEGTLRAIAMQAINLDRRRQNGASNG